MLVMLTVCCVLDDPSETVIVSGFGLATRPEVPPVPTLKLTGKFNDPTEVVTKTVPE